MVGPRRGLNRRAILRRSLHGAAAVAAVGCAPGTGAPSLFGGAKVVHAAAFLSPESTSTERGVVELQRAANAINALRPGYEVKVHFMSLPPRPTPGPNSFAPPPAAPADGGPTTAPAPTPTPFSAWAIALEQANAGGELAMGGPPPDIVLLTQAFELPYVVERKLITPLDDLLKADPSIKLDEYAPGALEAVRTRGRVAVLPLAGNVNFLLHDSALFRSAGVESPSRDWTWAAFLQACQRLTRLGGERDVWGTVAHNSTPLLLSMLWGHGAELVARDGRRSGLGEPAARQAVQAWVDLMERHRVALHPGSGSAGSAGSAGGAGAATSWQTNWGPSEMWLYRPEPNQTSFIVGSGTGGGNPRLATMVTSNLPSQFAPSSQSPQRTILPADLPRGPQGTARGAQFTLGAALALGAKVGDPKLALRAGLALADHLLSAPVSFGFPVRKVDGALVRRIRPQTSEEEAEVLASAVSYSRGVPPELVQRAFTILNGRIMSPLLRGQTTVDEALRDAASQVEDALKA